MPKRGKINQIACEPCRRRKIRCNGARPICGACKDRNSTECSFEILPGFSRTGALKSEVSQLKASNCSLMDLYWQLKHGNDSDAWSIVERIRSEEIVFELPDPEAQVATPSDDARDPSKPAPHVPFADKPVGAYPQGNMTEEPEVVPSSGQSIQSVVNSSLSPAGDKERFLQDSLLSNMEKIRKGFRIQRLCISEIFLCHDNKAFEALAINLELGRGLFVTSSALCEICAVAATSGQYVRNLIEPEILDYWYDAAKQRFDDCIESSPVSAVRIAALIGLYNLLNKSTVAFAYFGMGRSLAARYLKDESQHEFKSAEGISCVVQILKSLEFCNGWLQATLGYISTSANANTVSKETGLSRVNEHDPVHAAMASIAVLKAVTMRMLWSSSSVPDLLASIQSLQRQLREWYASLPLTAQLGQIGTDAHISLKTSICYVHLLHLGAVMLIFRRGLAGLQSPEDRAALSIEQKVLLTEILDDGIVAARQSVLMIHLLRASAQSTPHCWIIIYQAYVSGMIIIYHAVQLRLTGRPDESWKQSMDAAAKALEVLSFCCEFDPVAQKFFTALSLHYESLQSATPALTSPSLAESVLPQSSDYLYDIPPKSAQLRDTSCQLFIRLCNPYNDEHAMVERKEGDVDPRLVPSEVQS